MGVSRYFRVANPKLLCNCSGLFDIQRKLFSDINNKWIPFEQKKGGKLKIG